MIVAITGGGGFIGGELVLRHLEIGDEVRVLSRGSKDDSFLREQSISWFQFDADDNAILERFVDGVDILYHCAGETFDASHMQAANIDFTQKLITAATGRAARWVQLSTVAIYGCTSGGHISENSPFSPVGEYGKTKLESDIAVEVAAKNGAFEYVIVRPTTVYGERMRSQALYKLFSYVYRRFFFFIGTGVLMNYIHVSNVVEALVLSGKAEQASGQSYIVSDCRPIEEFITVVSAKLNVKNPRLRMPEFLYRAILKTVNLLPLVTIRVSIIDAMTSRCFYISDKIKIQLGYQPVMSMEEGIAVTALHWKHINKLKNNKIIK